jgi:hypothetical protein
VTLAACSLSVCDSQSYSRFEAAQLGGLLEQELWTGGAQHVPEMPEGRGDVSVVERARVAEFAAERQLVAAEQQQELEETELEEMEEEAEEEAEEEDVEGLLLRIQRAAGPLSRWPAWALAMVRATQLESCHEVLVLGIFMCTRSPTPPTLFLATRLSALAGESRRQRPPHKPPLRSRGRKTDEHVGS